MIKEFFRKRLVALKRRPHNIPLVLLAISFFVYSLNTTPISDTTTTLQGKNMGFYGFITMLTSILIFVVFLNAFPKREKVKWPLVIVMYAMFAIIVFCDIMYAKAIDVQVAKFDKALAENAVSILKEKPFILTARNLVVKHAVLIGIDAVLVALIPVYGNLLRRINTSVYVEDNGQMGEISISEE